MVKSKKWRLLKNQIRRSVMIELGPMMEQT